MYSFVTSSTKDIANKSEPGFLYYQEAIRLIGTHPQVFLFISSLLTISLILYTTYKYVDGSIYAIFLFVTIGFYVTSMNGLRQCLVAAVLFWATKYIIKGKFFRYALIVLIMMSIHSSAIVMIPIYFIVRTKAWSGRIIFFSISFIFGIAFFLPLSGFFTNIISSTQYGNYVDVFSGDISNGANLFRILVQSVPVVLGFVFRKKLTEKMANYDIIMNFSLINVLIFMLGFYNWLFIRLAIYFELYNIILIPLILIYCFSERDRIFIKGLAFVLYTIFFLFDVQAYVYCSYFLNINLDQIGSLTKTFY